MRSKRYVFVLAVLLLCAAGSAKAVEGDSLWARHYGGSGFEYAYAICPAGDGGFLLAGFTNSIGAGGYDMYLLKVNAQGDSLWSHAYGDSGNDYAYAITPSGDGGFLLAGETNSFDPPYGQQTYLVKVNAQGNLLWSRHYGTGADEYARSIIPSGDGGFLLAGSTNLGPTSYDMWLLKVNALGDSLWSYAYGGYNLQWAYSIVPAGDGNFAMGGITTAGFNPDQMQMVKLNSQGSELWSVPYGNYYYGDEEAYALIPSGDGGFLLAGRITGYFTQMHESYVVRTNSSGDTLWTRTFGGWNDDWTNATLSSGDGGFLLAGQSGSYGASGNWDVWLVKVNSQGDSLWGRTYGTTNQEFCQAIAPSGDGGYMLAGYANVDALGWNWQMYLVKIAGPTPPSLNVTMTPLNPPIIIPANGGSFQFNATVQRVVGPANAFWAWARNRNPDGTYTPVLLGPVQINPPVGVTVTRQRTQVVPSSWLAGQHYYVGYAHSSVSYPPTDADSFAWTKSAVADGGATVWEACNYGEEFPYLVNGYSTPRTFVLIAATPNPFNPSAVIRYQILEARNVSLKVYDTAGRLVANLVDGWREAGSHQVTFDGSGLAAGVYLVRLEAGKEMQVEKVVLLK